MEHAALARWIELSEAEGVAGAVEAEQARGLPSVVEPMGRARLVYGGPGSPLNQVYGMGFDGPVQAEDIERVIAFFARWDEPARIHVCPMAHPSLIERTRAAGFGLLRFTDILARPLSGPEEWAPRPDLGFRLRAIDVADPAEVEWLAQALARGFADGAEPSDTELSLEKTMILQPNALAVVAEMDGVAMGGGLVGFSQERAALFAGSTLPEHRKKGVQTAVMRERLRLAALRGCRLGVVGASPGVPTRRNAERLGFQLAYTRPTLIRPLSVVEK